MRCPLPTNQVQWDATQRQLSGTLALPSPVCRGAPPHPLPCLAHAMQGPVPNRPEQRTPRPSLPLLLLPRCALTPWQDGPAVPWAGGAELPAALPQPKPSSPIPGSHRARVRPPSHLFSRLSGLSSVSRQKKATNCFTFTICI